MLNWISKLLWYLNYLLTQKCMVYNGTVFDIETVIRLNWTVWNRTVWLNWIAWNSTVSDNSIVYLC